MSLTCFAASLARARGKRAVLARSPRAAQQRQPLQHFADRARRQQPSAVVLDKLATALGVSVASLFEVLARAEPPSPLLRVADQPDWSDPASGYRTPQCSPPGVSPLQLVDVVFPPGQTVRFETAERGSTIHQLVWMIDGSIHRPWRPALAARCGRLPGL